MNEYQWAPITTEEVERLIEAAVLAEREACAKVCDKRISSMFSEMFDKGWNSAAKYCAADIRARTK